MKTFRFDEIAYNSTQKVKPTEADKEHYIGLEHIDGECLYISRWGSDVAPIGEKLVMRKGDILFGKRRAYQRKVAIAPIDGIFSAHGLVLRPKEDVVDKDYFPFFMSSNQFLDRAIQISVGGLSPTINWKDLARQKFTLPSLSEQKVLADKLWAAYRVKESYKKLLAATDDMLKAKFMEMFGNPLDATDSEKVKLGEICTINPRKDKKIELDINVSFFPMDKIFEDGRYTELPIRPYLEVSKGFTYAEEGDVIFAKITPCMENGKGMILKNLANKVGFGSTEFHVLRPLENTSTAEFLYVLLSLPQFRIEAAKNMTGTGGQRRVPTSFLSDFKILPPSMPLQEEFANIYTQAEATKESLRKSIENIDQVIKSLINQ
ncbi:MAG: restriction endonuclease subunit S [Paludibacteraceae bacterium]|nr:restriction endonuclease subunit S [Paludibacteraceae bacterium]